MKRKNDAVEILEEENEPSVERQDADGASVELSPMRNQEGRERVRIRVYGSPLSTSDDKRTKTWFRFNAAEDEIVLLEFF